MLMNTLSTPFYGPRPSGIPGWLWIIGTWIERSRQRHALGELDHHLLDDIGISRAERMREVSKPFWR